MPVTITSERIAVAVLAHLHGTAPRPRRTIGLHEGSPLTVVHVAGLRDVDADDPMALPADGSRWVAAAPHDALSVVDRAGADVVLVEEPRRAPDLLGAIRDRHPAVLRLAVVDGDDRLPTPLPTTVHRVIRRQRSVEEIGEALRGAIGLRRHVHDPVVRGIVAATERIGGADIRSIVASGRHPGIPARGACIPGAAPSVLARHATEVARCAALVARPEDRATARAAGFLHLLGVLFEAEQQPDRLTAVNRRAHREGRRLVDVERELFGNDHVELAAHVLARWGVDAGIVEAVARSHDAPTSWEAPFDAVNAVRVARLLALTGRHALSLGPAYREPLPIDLEAVSDWVCDQVTDHPRVAVGV